MVYAKPAVSGNDRPDLSDTRHADLKVQFEPQLKPVLRPKNLATLDLETGINIVQNVSRMPDYPDLASGGITTPAE